MRGAPERHANVRHSDDPRDGGGPPPLHAGRIRGHGPRRRAAELSAHALLYSELRFHPGQGQGVRRLPTYADRIAAGVIDPAAPWEVVKQTAALALVDAHRAPGSVTGIRAMRLAVAKAKVAGIGHVVVRNGTHYGSSAVHAHEAVEAGCLGIAITNAGAEMAPWGGVEARVGTNPWAIGAPSDRAFPVILDIALTAAGKGMMRWHAREAARCRWIGR